MISLEKCDKRDPDEINAIGKLRAADGELNTFVLYDAGENPKTKGIDYKNIRKEHGTFIYSYVPCNVGNIRKMRIIYPVVKYHVAGDDSNTPHSRQKRELQKWKGAFTGALNSSDKKNKDEEECMLINGEAFDVEEADDVKFRVADIRPTNNRETLLYNYRLEKNKNIQYKVFMDNPPYFNPKNNTYAYDFRGRVTKPSIKNF